MLELQTTLIFWVIVSFGIMVLVLAKFAFPPLVKVLEDRERKIRESIEQAEQIKTDAEHLLKGYEEKLAEARAEAQKMIADGKELGERIRAEIVQKSEEEAKRMIAKAEEQINLDVEQARKDLRAEVGSISVDLASKVIERELDMKSHEELIEKYLSEVGSKS